MDSPALLAFSFVLQPKAPVREMVLLPTIQVGFPPSDDLVSITPQQHRQAKLLILHSPDLT